MFVFNRQLKCHTCVAHGLEELGKRLSNAMEIVGEEDGAKTAIQYGRKAVFGRGIGFNTNDRTVSRRHLEFEAHAEASQTEPRVSFEVLGKNPIWIWSKSDGKVRVFRRLEKGEMVAGDCFCVSGKRPNWFSLRKFGVEENQKCVLEVESLQSAFEVEDVDVSGIDPVKEFGFVVMGHEFEPYPKHKIRDVKSWDWFIEEPTKESDDDDDDADEFERKVRKCVKRKRRKGEENDDDDEWTGEIEDDKVNMRKVNRPKYSTRSKDHRDKPQKDRKGSENSMQKKTYDGDADEDEETLGGFIVGDDDADQEETDEEEEEEEFVEEEDDELDD